MHGAVFLLLLNSPFSPVVASGHGFLCIGSITIGPSLTACVVNQPALTSDLAVQPALESGITSQAALTADLDNQPALTAKVRINPCQ